MKKVGIITIYDEDNYGNRLQNYAVQEILVSLGFDVETIKNVNIIEEFNLLEEVKKVLPERRERFLDFNNSNMKISDDVIIHDSIPKNFHENYDYFVIGSDQIWNHEFPERFSNFSFAEFAPTEKRIALSASFGIEDIEEEHFKKYEHLKGMKAISVREYAGKKLVKDIVGRDDAVVLIDPTMMLTKEKWNTVMKKPEMLKSDKYILKYFLGNVSEDKNAEIEKFAKENGCDVIDILDKDSFYATGPSEFLYLIKNAFLVLTDSFHSCVFSILFNRPFLIFDRDEDGMRNMNSRIDTLLEKFGLENRRFYNKINQMSLEVDYSNSYRTLEKERKKVIEFLTKALEMEES